MHEVNFWSIQDIILLKKLRDIEKLKWKEIGMELDRSYHGVYHKYHKIKRQDKMRDKIFK